MAENVAPSPAKRARKPNFTPAECTVIFEEAEENISIIKNKFSSTLTNKNKTRIWEQITDKVNALGVSERTVVEVKEKWRGMVSGAKKEHNKCAIAMKKTGGGKKPISPKATTTKIIELFETDPSFSGVSGGIDSAQVSDLSTMDTEVVGTESELCAVTSHCILPDTCESSNPCELSQLDCPGIYSDTVPSVRLEVPVLPTKPQSRKKVTLDDINEMHLQVLKKENVKLDLEIENLKLKKKEIMLRIMELESRSGGR